MSITISYAINITIYVLTIVAALYSAFKDKIKKPFWKMLLMSLGSFFLLALAGSTAFIYIGVGGIGQSLMTVITSSLGFCIPYIVLDYSLGQCVFISTVVKCYVDDLTLISTVAYYLASGEIPDSYMDFPVWPLLLAAVVTFPLIMVFYKKLMRPALDDSGFLLSWKTAWIVPYFANIMYAMYMQPVFTEVTAFPGLEFSFVPFLWVVLTFSSYIILLKALVEQGRSAKLHEELHISDIRVAAQQKQLENLQQNIEDTAKARHDIRHFLLSLQGFANKKDFEGMSEYLEKTLVVLDKEASEIYTNNLAVDAVLGHYRRMAVKEEIDVKFNVRLEGKLGVTDTDMCIILGNLLENAYEACMRQKSGNRYIRANIHQNGKMLVIIVENSYEGSVQKQDGVFLSSKEKMRKGIGITSVVDVTKKYRGIPRFEYDGRKFKVSLLLGTVREGGEKPGKGRGERVMKFLVPPR